MFTGFQALLDQGAAFLDAADPETVAIAGFPVPLPANIGSIFRERVPTENGWRIKVRGTLEIRRANLAALAPGKADPSSDTEITVRGKVYRVSFTTGDTTAMHVEFASFS